MNTNEDRGVTISIINNNPGLVIKAQTEDEYLAFRTWAVPQFKAIREAYSKYLTGNTHKTPTSVNNNQETDLKCATCGKPMVYTETTGGKKMYKCSGQGWDKINKRSTGCPQKPTWINEDNDRTPQDIDRGDITREEPNF